MLAARGVRNALDASGMDAVGATVICVRAVGVVAAVRRAGPGAAHRHGEQHEKQAEHSDDVAQKRAELVSRGLFHD